MRIEKLKTVNSTNLYLEKFIKGREDVIVCAEEQTAGMGTKGRSFVSQKGGLYVSKLAFHRNLPASEIYSVNINACMAVVKTLLCYGLQPKIKWPNDVFVCGKKICGILINNSLCGDKVDYSIIGIGVNVNNEFDGELKNIAISMREACGKSFDLDEVFMTLCTNLSFPSNIKEYAAFSSVLNRKVKIIRGNRTFEAVPTEILPDGRLKLDDGTLLSAGELDLKIGL